MQISLVIAFIKGVGKLELMIRGGREQILSEIDWDAKNQDASTVVFAKIEKRHNQSNSL